MFKKQGGLVFWLMKYTKKQTIAITKELSSYAESLTVIPFQIQNPPTIDEENPSIASEYITVSAFSVLKGSESFCKKYPTAEAQDQAISSLV